MPEASVKTYLASHKLNLNVTRHAKKLSMLALRLDVSRELTHVRPASI